jgi:hypothetical protein
MEPRLDPPNTDLEENMWDQICEMTTAQVIDNLAARVPYLEDELRERLHEILLDEWRYQE